MAELQAWVNEVREIIIFLYEKNEPIELAHQGISQ